MVACLVLMILAACTKPEPSFDSAAWEQDVMKWRHDRLARLQKEDGWLTLVGLFWLKDGPNTFGSGPGNSIVMPAPAPANCGTLTLQNGVVTLTPDAGAGLSIGGKPVAAPVPLIDDTKPNGPTVVQTGSIRFNIVLRSGRYGIRVKDAQAPARVNFKGLDYFPPNPKWRIEARFEPYNPPKKVSIPNVLGQATDEVAPGALVFDVDGREYRIDPILEQGETDLFIIFKDQTSRDSTYQAGRFLYAKPPGPDGKTIVDFNKAYNPPCTFSPYATCPLPPPQNRLPFRIEAGEKRYAGHH